MDAYDSLPDYKKEQVQRIDKEIHDYLAYSKKHHVQQSRFAKRKLRELEKRKSYILTLKEYSKQIDWDAVRFEDYNIRIHINGILSQPFPLRESRKSFEYLKNYIARVELTPISAQIFGNTIVAIHNLEQIQKVIEILSVQDEINLYLQDFEGTTIEKILSKLNNVSNQHLLDTFKLRERGPYLNYLCEVQSTEYKIIPTTEIIKTNPRTDMIEETFLFTSTRKNGVYIIWESTSINRATYIFKTAIDSYNMDVQRVFDFIASSQPKKRRKLRYLISKGKNLLKTIGVVDHDGLKQWRARIESILQR